MLEKLLSLSFIVLILLCSCENKTERDIDIEINMVNSGKIVLETGIEYPIEKSDIKGLVFFSRGSGDGDMTSYADGFFDTFLREIFLKNGFGIVYQNKRGIGNSTGNWKWSSIESRAEDLLSVISYYKNIDEFADCKIGVIGHSQGGWVAMETLSVGVNEIDFVISLAGPVLSVAESDLERERFYAECEGLTEEDLESYITKRENKHKRLLRSGYWFPFFQRRFMYNILQYRPDEALKSSTIPVLIALGDRDNMAYADSNIARLYEIFNNEIPDNITVYKAIDCDHFFKITDSLCFDYYNSLELPVSQTFLNFYSNWLEEYAF